MLIRLCAGIFWIAIHGSAIGNSTINLVNQVYTVPFDTLLACSDKQQDSRGSKVTLYAWFSELTV